MDHEVFIEENERVINNIKKTRPDLELMKITSSFNPELSHDLYEQKQLKTKLKAKNIALTGSKLFYEYLSQDPQSWPSYSDSEPLAEKIHQEYKKGFQEITAKETEISSMCKMAEEASGILQARLKDTENQKKDEKLKTLDAKISKCHRIKTKTLASLQKNVKVVDDLKNLVDEAKKLVEKMVFEESQMSDVCENVECYRKLVEDMEKLGGLRVKLVASNCLCVEFVHISLSDDRNLQLSLEFSNDDLGDPVLTSAMVNEDILNVDDVLRRGTLTSDVVALVDQLQSRWMTHLPLICEINQLRKMYAVDWIEDENLLRIIVGKNATTVCTLAIPDGYPLSGKIIPVSICGDTESGNTTICMPASEDTLLNWAKYLEEKYRDI